MQTQHCQIAVCGFIALILPFSAIGAGRYSWFGPPPLSDSPSFAETPLPLNLGSRLRFGVDTYRSLAPSPLLTDDMDAFSPEFGPTHEMVDTLQFYGEMTSLNNPSYTLLAGKNRMGGARGTAGVTGSRLTGFGVKWRHRLDPVSSIALSAGYGEYASPLTIPRPDEQVTDTPSDANSSVPLLNIADTRAAVSWSSKWGHGLRPGITGSVFVGDEGVRDEAYQHLGRKYFGFSLGGEVTLFQQHTPYLSYRLQRYSTDDPLLYRDRYDDQSSLSAGWKWQVQSNWSVQAEASYGLNNNESNANFDLYPQERNRLFFGTRFDFR